MEHQQDIAYQLDLFMEQNLDTIHQCGIREHVEGANLSLVKQVKGDNKQGRALATDLTCIVLYVRMLIYIVHLSK
ncbi:hypothetical protein K4L44_05505 [Halosquirtibacter laminarini]|uniref:Uncharacterized protein n=1 Tax=Halosquirtibacter laminarini TaxID=3374600 RepID=A0AC61NPD4_9BACT|nr:hypothetical protein K4L44_05505 [Prolixibacteraceae bacterium]